MKYISIIFILLANNVWAIDKQDVPRYIAEFEARIKPLENYIQSEARSNQDYAKGYTELLKALDKELNVAYKKLIAKLPKSNQEKLRQSQKHWLNFRDAEIDFLSKQFNRKDNGGSSVMTRGIYISTLIKTRIKALLWYRKGL